MDDNKLIELIIKGEINNYDNLMIKYTREIFKYLYNFTSSYETTEDLMQEVFSNAYYSLKNFNPIKSSFRTYLYRIAHNHVINFLKSKPYRNSLSNISVGEHLFTSKEDVEGEIIKEEQMEEIIFVIEKILNKKAKGIIYMHFFSDLSIKEIAETFNIPIKNVYHTIDYSLKKIRKEVRSNG